MVTQARKTGGGKKRPPAVQKTIPAVIERGKSYSLKTFRRITGFSFEIVRDMRSRGLRVKRIGNEHWVLGDDWHDFLAREPSVEEAREMSQHRAPSDETQSEATCRGGDGSD